MTDKEKRSLKIRLGQRLSHDKSRVMEIVKEEIDKTETTMERPHGEWICKGSVGNGTWCSVCDTNIKLFPNRYSFCPNCGADMRKEGEALFVWEEEK